MKSHLPSLSLAALTCLLASCSGTPSCGNSHPYASNVQHAPLQAPAGVTLPKPDAAYTIPAAGTKAGATPAPAAGTNGAQPCLVTPPSVLTKEDMSKPPISVPKPTAPPAAKQPPSSGGYGPPRVAASKAME